MFLFFSRPLIYGFWRNAHDQYTNPLARPLLIALQVVRTSFGFHLRECMGSSFPLWNKLTTNNRRLLIAAIAAVFHFVHPVEKGGEIHHMLTKNSVTFSCQSKQVSRCCINFLYELTCQILTNQSMKFGRTWPTRDLGKKRSTTPVVLNNWLNFRVRG